MKFDSNHIIAEIGSVHDGSFGNALKLIDAAADCGATSVKFQTHIAEAESLRSAPSPSYFQTESRFEYFQRTRFTIAQWRLLSEKAKSRDLVFLSSPFSIEAVDLLENIDVQAYKIASGEVTNLPLLKYIAATGKPVLLSTGMSEWLEIDEAVDILKSNPICIMHCTSIYPCPTELVGLNIITNIRERFPELKLGFSDHTLGSTAAISAVSLGATVIEKHFTFSRLMYGSDAKNGMEPREFIEFSRSLKEAWAMRSSPIDKDLLARTVLAETRVVFQKSIVAARDLDRGQALRREDFCFKKPGDGLHPRTLDSLIGRCLIRSVSVDHKFTLDDFE